MAILSQFSPLHVVLTMVAR